MKKFSAFILSIILSFSVIGLVGCDNSNERIISVAIVPVKTFVEEVVKDKFKVVTAIPSGQSPETYEPKPKEMVDLNKSEVYFSIGIPNENVNVVPKLSSDTKKILLNERLLAAGFTDRYFENGGRDPHIWLSVKRAIKCVEIIRDEVIKLDGENADFYASNANAYVEKLNLLYNDLSAKFSNVSEANKNVIVYHPSFGYFTDEFGLNMYALEKDGHEITPKILSEMIEFAKANSIKKVFYQAETSSSGADAFATEIGGKAYMLTPLSGDYINNLKQMANYFLE